MLWRRFRWFSVASAVALHAATWLLLGLDYWTWAGAVLVLFVDWPALFDVARERRTRVRGEVAAAR